jgi:rubrerythrin
MNIVRKFQKRLEDFTCINCGTQVQGNGFTNHCPRCLYSKHVDIFPGDRLEDCGGIMFVTEVRRKGDGYQIQHTCRKCGATSRDHFRDHDNIDALIAYTKQKDEA